MPTWGRGGAGNIVTDEQVQETTRRVAEDLEANHPTSQPTTTTTTAPPSYTTQDYAHMGRGGAGNWFVPADEPTPDPKETADPTPAPQASAKPAVSKPWTPPNTELPIARGGRGGAGNFTWESEEDKQRKREAEARRREGLERRVVADVERGLKMPERAVLGGGGGRAGELEASGVLGL
ncbi:uncharacterized protein BDZ99DRAFT_565335 [Mytilinidion resinicola]|uniref:Uncharacterized protein n=1 Tax=Mytilinidion resinicola TaxID=574789 RepID=A0A6A6ZBM2_9PEZI|nr:uncharacterized protein BDZ99DRAFT_565335 [Mytilinidion resinicola]KAF2817617.1 hypothetical protein BDZ99DRAFT_565335 [Mytilinidion resinicola]